MTNYLQPSRLWKYQYSVFRSMCKITILDMIWVHSNVSVINWKWMNSSCNMKQSIGNMTNNGFQHFIHYLNAWRPMSCLATVFSLVTVHFYQWNAFSPTDLRKCTYQIKSESLPYKNTKIWTIMILSTKETFP